MTTIVATPTWQLGTSLLFNVDDNNGVRWAISSTTGWYDSPPVRLRTAPKSQADGDYRAKARFGGKTVVLNGWVKAPTGILAENARNLLLAQFVGDQMQLIWTSDYTARYANVELADSVKAPPVSNGCEFDFQITLFQADPVKYWWSGTPYVLTFGPQTPAVSSGGLDWSTGGGLDWSTGGGLNWGTASSNGVITVTNPGTAPAYPVFTLMGPLTNPTITGSDGSVLAYTGAALAATDTLVLDTKATTVLRNGVDRRLELTTPQWATVPASSSKNYSITTTNPADTGTLTVTLTPSDR